MEFTKYDSQMAKGIAIIGMVMLHLFCRLGELPYSPLIWLGDIPLVYYLGLLGDMCVPIFCFCSGYAHYLLSEEFAKEYKNRIPKKLLRFICNYWLVVVLFSTVGLILGKQDIIPKSLSEFLGNIFLYNMSYNGAWWFVLTYIILLLLSPILIKLTQKVNALFLIASSSLLYFVAYILRFNVEIDLNNPVLDWILSQCILVGTSQFTYVIGLFCRKYRVISKIHQIQAKHIFTLTGAAILLGHCVIQSAFLAPFTALAVLSILILFRLPTGIKNSLIFLGKHSTNIWLIHMFFYTELFDGLVFAAKYPLLIIVFMFFICIMVSMFINIIYAFICKWMADRRWV